MHKTKLSKSSLKLSEEILNKKLICRLYLHTDEDNNNNVVVMYSNFDDEAESKLFIENFKQPIVLGLDHPKMGLFYYIFNDLTAIYGRPKYV